MGVGQGDLQRCWPASATCGYLKWLLHKIMPRNSTLNFSICWIIANPEKAIPMQFLTPDSQNRNAAQASSVCIVVVKCKNFWQHSEFWGYKWLREKMLHTLSSCNYHEQALNFHEDTMKYAELRNMYWTETPVSILPLLQTILILKDVMSVLKKTVNRCI